MQPSVAGRPPHPCRVTSALGTQGTLGLVDASKEGARGDQTPVLDEASFDALYQRLRGLAGWAEDDRRGALNYLTPFQVAQAAREVRSGRTVSMAAAIENDVTPDNPEPCRHQMTAGTESEFDSSLHFAADRVAMNIHSNADSHLDALCHVLYKGTMYNGVPRDKVTVRGAAELSVDVARNGIVGRGVLLDIPRLEGRAWLEPGEYVTGEALAAAETAQHVRVGQGDLLFVRVGHRPRRDHYGPWDAAQERAGLHPTAMEFLAERRVAVMGSDGNNDTAPSVAATVEFPIHVLAIHAMGMHLLDYLQFEDLLAICQEEDRWSFLCVIAPLRLPAATGSPVNPIAVL
jgi:kynurenine formamidase